MQSVTIIIVLLVALVAAGAVELALHRRRLRRLRVRVHVNGTRGKSSVTRLVAAGLRAGGITTCAKTTGTLARFIMPDGREFPVFRPSGANILEQLRIVRAAVANGAEALVIECMALQPILQWLSEARMVRATHAVITNARADHLDVMGPDELGVAQALCGMVPPGGVLYTAERRLLPVLADCARDRACELVPVTAGEVDAITDEDLAGFPYIEHAENLALALKVCGVLGVDRATALRGMWSARPDPGVMTDHELSFFGRRLVFVNALAANDPESTERLWDMALSRYPELDRRLAVFNCRADRADRSRQLGTAVAQWKTPTRLVLMGEGTYFFARAATRAGFDPALVVHADGQGVDQIFETIVEHAGARALVVGMGNIGGRGMDLARYFRNRGNLEATK